MEEVDDILVGQKWKYKSGRIFLVIEVSNETDRVTLRTSNRRDFTVDFKDLWTKCRLEDSYEPIINPHIKQTCSHSWKKERWFNATWHEYCSVCGNKKD